MSNKIILKHNREKTTRIPSIDSLEIGELAVDNIDGKIYTRKGTGVAGDTIESLGGEELVKVTEEKTLYNGSLIAVAQATVHGFEIKDNVSSEFNVGEFFILGGDNLKSTSYKITNIFYGGVDTTISFKKPLGRLPEYKRVVEIVQGWKLADNPTTETGDKSVNITPDGDASQDGIVYINGLNYKGMETSQIGSIARSELGTFIFDKDKNSLVQCTNATSGSLVWSTFGPAPAPVAEPTAPSDLTVTPSRVEIQAILNYAKDIAVILKTQGITK